MVGDRAKKFMGWSNHGLLALLIWASKKICVPEYETPGNNSHGTQTKIRPQSTTTFKFNPYYI